MQHAQTEKPLPTTNTEIEKMQNPPEDLENLEMAVEVSDEDDDQVFFFTNNLLKFF